LINSVGYMNIALFYSRIFFLILFNGMISFLSWSFLWSLCLFISLLGYRCSWVHFFFLFLYDSTTLQHSLSFYTASLFV